MEKPFESPNEQLMRRSMTPRREGSFRRGTGAGAGAGALTNARPQSLLKRYRWVEFELKGDRIRSTHTLYAASVLCNRPHSCRDKLLEGVGNGDGTRCHTR